MKSILSFNLPEEENEFRLAQEGAKWKEVVREVDTFLRNKLKYGHDFKSADEALETLRKILHEEMDILHISLED